MAIDKKEFAAALRRVLLQPAAAEYTLTPESTRLDLVAMRLVKDAHDGNFAAVKEIADRIDGKAVQSTELTGADGENIIITMAVAAAPWSQSQQGVKHGEDSKDRR